LTGNSLVKLWNKITHYPKISLVILAFIAFIALGMPDGLLGVAWPSIRTSFSVPLDAIGMFLPVTVAGYLTSSFLSGPLISRWGIGKVLTVSCALTGMALVGYTLVPVWWMMVLLGVLAGLGAGAIDAGINSYVAAHFGEGLMQWLHASYGIGITFGPIIMTIALTTLNSWRMGYRIVGGFQIILAVSFVFTLSLWNQKDTSTGVGESRRLNDYKMTLIETLSQPRVWLSVLLFFLYVGAEISLGTWTYSLLTDSRGIGPTTAGMFAGSFWATYTIGRVFAGLYAKRVGVNLLVQGSIAAAILGTILLIWNPFEAANLVAVVLIGFAIAPIFPALMSGTNQRVGPKHAANTIGMQMAASGLGAAFFPSLFGVLARQFSLEIVPICLSVEFLVLFGFYRFSMTQLMISKESAL
jgi:fucose permease